MASTSANPPLPSPSLFKILLRSSMDFMVSNPRDATSDSGLCLLYICINSSMISKSHFEDLIHTLHYLFNKGLRTLQLATQEEVDPTTTLATLASLMAATSHATDHSSESIAQSALEDIRQLNLLSVHLQTKLARYNYMASYVGMTAAVAVGVAACAVPAVGLNTVQPLSQLVSTVWKERMINPLEEKLKVVETHRFMIHHMIIQVAKMKEMVQGIASLVAKQEDGANEHQGKKKLLEDVEKAFGDSLAHMQMVGLELVMGNLS